MAQYGEEAMLKAKEPIKKLDHFQNESSSRFQKYLERLETVAIRFRGHTPKPEEINKEKEPEPSHKIESLSNMSIKINLQLNQLDYLISDLENI